MLPQAERDRWRQATRSYVEGELAGMGDFGKKLSSIAEKVNSENPY